MQVVGRNYNGVPDNPCRVKRIPSPIPTKQWYLRPPVIALTGGLLPFGSIFIETYFIFTSFWNYKARALLRLQWNLISDQHCPRKSTALKHLVEMWRRFRMTNWWMGLSNHNFTRLRCS